MPPVPAACQPIAVEIAELQSRDAQLRAQLSTLSGAEAWAVLARIAAGREALQTKQAELGACILAHSATLQGQIIIIDLTPSPTTTERTVVILDASPKPPIQLATSAVQSDATFSFGGQLPLKLAFTVSTAGDPDILGPDFRSPIMAPADVPPPPLHSATERHRNEE